MGLEIPLSSNSKKDATPRLVAIAAILNVPVLNEGNVTMIGMKHIWHVVHLSDKRDAVGSIYNQL